MHMSRAVSLSTVAVFQPKPLAGALAAAMLVCSSAYAASFGHSRLVSQSGQPLQINVPVTQLSSSDLSSFSAVPAPASAWQQAGLTPPVDLASLRVALVDGYASGSKQMQVRSSQVFNGAVADLLLDVTTASGQQRFQVSLLSHAGLDSITSASTDGASTGSQAASPAAPSKAIRVKRGDTMFAIAQRHAVSGVSVYQMMIALQRANPQAFIDGNLNLVKAGATLSMPGREALTAVSDQEARRLFQQQAQAFAQYRQKAATQTSAVAEGSGAAGVVSSATPEAATPTSGSRDQVRLSGEGDASAGNAADDAVATGKGIADTQQRVSQLEDNVKTLSDALQAQGQAASALVLEGGQPSDSAASGQAPSAEQTGSNQTASNQAGAESSSAGAEHGSANNAASGGTEAASNTAEGNTSGANTEANASSNAAAAATGVAASTNGADAQNTDNSAASAPANEGQAGSNTSDAQTAESISNKTEQSVSWFQEHLLGVITGILAFIVLFIAWLLRRTRNRSNGSSAGPITEAMVQEKLDQINLELEQDAPPRPGAR